MYHVDNELGINVMDIFMHSNQRITCDMIQTVVVKLNQIHLTLSYDNDPIIK